MRSEAQLAVATSVRHAIWNWIETFPSEYYELANGSRKLDGAPERVFDAFMQIKNEQNRKVIWPTLTALLIISYDRYKQVTLQLDDVSQYKVTKKVQFLSFEAGSCLTSSATGAHLHRENPQELGGRLETSNLGHPLRLRTGPRRCLHPARARKHYSYHCV